MQTFAEKKIFRVALAKKPRAAAQPKHIWKKKTGLQLEPCFKGKKINKVFVSRQPIGWLLRTNSINTCLNQTHGRFLVRQPPLETPT